MKRVVYFLLCILVSSCSFFESKQKRTQELINEELRHIDWNSVDSYPFFYTCDEAATKAEQKSCFEETLIIHVTDIEKDAWVLKQMPEFDGVITQSLKNLPKLAPALKRGIPVNTKYRIPVQLNRN